jgi:MtN3 and saliva related transmembrane protein
MNLADIIASIAATFTTVAFIPQAILVWKTRNTVSISFLMYSVFISGLVLWTVYGFITWQWPIIIANIITTSIASSILWVKMGNMKNGEK